jgi:hypothetical protein
MLSGALRLAWKFFGGIKLRLDRSHDGFGDFVLYREDVGEVAVVTLCPNVAAGGDVVELRRDAHTIATLAHAAFEHVTDAKLLSNLLHMNGFTFVDE